jgi:menaquinol-cytochrome c reductase iron-sulfur subunit
VSEEEKERRKQGISRRKFLTYTLGGTGGFLASVMLYPMVRFAVDPVTKGGAEAEFVDVGPVDEFNETYKSVQFSVKQKDGWYTPKEGTKLTAWVRKEPNGEILALSPICKHLGCTVTWEGNPQFKNEFFCPCHFGRYDENGVNIPGTPPTAPLDMYETKVENGRLLLGKIVPRTGV